MERLEDWAVEAEREHHQARADMFRQAIAEIKRLRTPKYERYEPRNPDSHGE